MTPSSITPRHPGPLVLGLGCERGTPADEVIALAEKALALADAAKDDVGFVASLDARRNELAIHAAADHFAVEARFFDAPTLEAVAPRLQTPSAVVFAHTGCHGVAEGAALVGAGPTSVLLVAKITSSHATAAIAAAGGWRLQGASSVLSVAAP